MKSNKYELTPKRTRDQRAFWWRLLCAALFILQSSLFFSCKKGDDVIVYQDQHRWVDKTIAMVAPLSNPANKSRLERTAQWMLDNFQQAQSSSDICVRLHLQWYDEDSEDMEALSTRLAADDSLAAIIGPFTNEHMATFAIACQQTEKPLIAPTATSEEIIRRYAVPTLSGQKDVRPFLWSLTETDVAFTEVLMSAYASFLKYYEFYISTSQDDNTGFFSPDDIYGQTFFNWAPFQAENLDLGLGRNELYKSAADLDAKLTDHFEGLRYNRIFNATFCVVKDLQQLLDVERKRFEVFSPQWVDEEEDPELVRYDPSYNWIREFVELDAPVFFAFSGISQEDINALSPTEIHELSYLKGFSPYADPTTGFEISYEGRFDMKPTFEECKLYDALLLTAFACYMMETDDNPDNQASTDRLYRNRAFNQAIFDICFPNSTDGSVVSATVWNATPMRLYLESLRQGKLPQFRGASGNISFDPETCTPAAGSFYAYWQITNGKIHVLNFFSSAGNDRVGDATAAWRYLYNENEAEKRFSQFAKDENFNIDYAPLTDQYAVLVHASTGFANYRHLADVLNVYQQLRRTGFDDDHIILIADRSIANSKQNPEPGVVRISLGGQDFMQGVHIDYDAARLSPDDVADILAGRQSERLPVVVPPSAGHNVMVYWSGHGHSIADGGTDEFAWRDLPVGQGFTRELLQLTVRQMQQDAAFRKMLIVAEPCYAQAVVNGIEGIPSVLAMTGANAQEQSWADHWNTDGSFWMCDRFTSNFNNAVADNPDITYRDLYLYCVQHTLGSHACIVNASNFGNLYHTGPAEFLRYMK